jgi:hypothetical protein
MALRNIVGNIVDILGTAFRLPEMGISEKIAGGPTIYTRKTPEIKKEEVDIRKLETGFKKNQREISRRGGGGGTPQSTPTPTYYEPPQGPSQSEEEARAAYEEEMRSGISAAYQPIFTELDKQIGLLPTQRQEFEQGIESLAGTQKTGVELQRKAGETALEGQKVAETAQAAGSLRDLEEDLRNQIRAWAVSLGGRGAGESSAPGMASEIVTRGGLKARAKVLSARDLALNQIAMKIQDVNNLASQELNKVEQWKSTNLMNIAQWATNRLNELGTAKANASSAQQNAINQLIQNTHEEFITRLRQLEDNYTQYKSSVSLWQQQRAGDLEDYKTKLGLAAKYTSTTKPTYADALKSFSTLYSTGQTIGDARQATINTYGIDPLAGLTLTSKKEEKEKQPLDLQTLWNLAQQ